MTHWQSLKVLEVLLFLRPIQKIFRFIDTGNSYLVLQVASAKQSKMKDIRNDANIKRTDCQHLSSVDIHTTKQVEDLYDEAYFKSMQPP